MSSLDTTSFLSRFEQHVDAFQETEKLFFLDEKTDIVASCSYKKLQTLAKNMAKILEVNHLIGERVIILMPSGIDFLVAMLACFYAKAIAVPLNIPQGKQAYRVAHIVSDCAPKAMLSTSEIITNLRANLTHMNIDLKNDKVLDNICFISIVSNSEKNLVVLDKKNKKENIALIQYTSGSTSYPKGVLVTDDNLVYMVNYISKSTGLTTSDKSLTWLPNYHDMGLVDGLLTPIYTGYPVYIMSPATFIKNPLIWLKAISRYHITHSGGPNFSYDLCAQLGKNADISMLDLTTWRSAYNAAEPIRSETIHKFLSVYTSVGFNKASLYCCYGLAEAVLMVTCQANQPLKIISVDSALLRTGQVKLLATTEGHQLVSSGNGRYDTHVTIVDPETFKTLPPYHIGEIVVEGPTVTAGYWNNEDATEKTFLKGTFLRTGDLGFLDEMGELFVTGRQKDLIIIHGENYYPDDIEKTAENLSPFSKIHDSAVFAIESDTSQEVILVLRLKDSPAKFNYENLAKQIAKEIYETNNIALSQILMTDQPIPKTSSGKIQRQATKKLFLSDKINILHLWKNITVQQETSEKTFHTMIENQLIFWLASHLNISLTEINKDQDFSAYALDSIQSTTMLNTIEKITEFSISLHDIKDYPSINALAEYITTKKFTTLNASDKTSKSKKTEKIAIPELTLD